MKGWLDKYQEGGNVAYADNTRVGNVPRYIAPKKGEDMPVSRMIEMTLDAPQRLAVQAITGKEQYLSEALDIKNPWEALAADAILDPTNLIGAGLVGKAAKAAKASTKKGVLSKAYKINPFAIKENGGWLDKYNDGGPVQPNYNDASVTLSDNFVGEGTFNKGRDYSPAWGGQFAMGGSIGGATQGIPGATGFMYARTGSIPSNGKYAKKTKASAQNGAEMRYYQEGLDFKPKSISKNGSQIIKDDRGQWAYPGEITEIGSNQITMQGVDYPVLGISDTGDTQMMYPNEDYVYDGESVTEIPMMAQGGQLTKLDQLFNFTNYNTKQPGGWLDKYQ
jgi:hypothetical protein